MRSASAGTVLGILSVAIQFLMSTSEMLPPLLDSCTMAFDVTDLRTNEGSIVEETSSIKDLQMTGLHLWKNDVASEVIVHRSTKQYIFHDGRGNCSKTATPTKWTDYNPLSLPDCFTPTILTAYDLLKMFNETNTWLVTNVSAEGVKNMDRYSATVMLLNKHRANVSIFFFTPWTQQPTDAKMVRSIEVVVIDPKLQPPSMSIVANLSYNFYSYKMHTDVQSMADFFLPPEGVFCDGSSDQPLPEVNFKNFLVSVDVLRNNEKSLSEIQLIYSSDEHIASFTNMNTSALAFNQGLNVSGTTMVVSQDFIHGLQYVIDSSTSSCSVVQPIPVTSGMLRSVYVPEKNQTILRFKNATDALLKTDLFNYTYVGQRFVDGVPLDVWTARQMTNNTCSAVYEVLFQKGVKVEDEKGHQMTATLPWALRVYNGCIPTTWKQRTTYEFYNFVPFSSGFIPWKRLDVSPCLSYSRNDSYLMVLVNATTDALSIAGLEMVENSMRQSLAKVSGVSPLRVSRFMFQPNGSSTMVFFQLANVSAVLGTQTEYYQAERDVALARRGLNQTLLNDYIITVPGERGKSLTFAIVGGTLADSYNLFHGGGGGSVIVNYFGYSGGSMAGLGISMLMLGSFFGLIVGFYLWKRNRGIAYQMYE